MPADRKQEDKSLHERLEKLSGDLEERHKGGPSQSRQEGADLVGKSAGQAMTLGFRVLTEMVAGIIVGGLIGWQFDVWFKTSPILLIIFLMLGTAAGFWNVYRIAVPSKRNRGAGPTESDPR